MRKPEDKDPSKVWAFDSVAMTSSRQLAISRTRVWDAQTGQTLCATDIGYDNVEVNDDFPDREANLPWHYLGVTPDGRFIVCGHKWGSLELRDVGTCDAVLALEGHGGRVTDIAVTPDGRFVASCSEDSSVRLWDLHSAKEITAFTGERTMSSCAIASDGRTIVAGDDAGQVHFLRLVAAKDP